jgi:ribonuclease HII
MNLVHFDQEISKNLGHRYIGGLDEVGRGCLAGPLVTAIVVFDFEKLNKDLENTDFKEKIIQINDSKKLTEKKRTELSIFIKDYAHFFHISEMSNVEIDTQGISQITNKSFFHNYDNANNKSNIDYVLTDAFKIKEVDEKIQKNIIDGDKKSLSIAAASIIAKNYRDNLMTILSNEKEFENFSFANHKGYGTKKHLEEIFTHGPSRIHRKSFEPIKSLSQSI